MKKYKVILTAKLARELIHEGFKIVDIKPNRHDKKRTVFVFENSKELQEYINDYSFVSPR